MKIVIAPDSFKESLSAAEVATQIEAGFREIFPDFQYRRLPIADGGEGTVDALLQAVSGQRRHVTVSDPLGRPVQAEYAILSNGTGVIEMAAASGLHLVAPHERDPRITSSRGTGELIMDALSAGVRHFIIGIGGSATNDAGAGLLQALGIRLVDSADADLASGGAALSRLAHINQSCVDPRLKECRFEVACDVNNPLTGGNGATAVFGPQKGATPQMIAELDEALGNFAAVIKRDLDADVCSLPGSGAAGGLGAALIGVLHARLRPGIEIVCDAMRVADAVQEADLVVTGEGCIDGQTACGKAPVGIAQIASQFGVPVIAIGGAVEGSADKVYANGIDAVFPSVQRACSIEQAFQDAAINVRTTARNIAAVLSIGAHKFGKIVLALPSRESRLTR
ncbi:glycerate kinase [Paraburkholderia caribensis]|uniref:Glycerate kinase n=1 Tax=Paraburkholderia caribensis TaxID=75105 RepID=A0A9Q6S8G8_9BURK|nr:glycerate kinase [Paraburkholderia caribensis]MCO4878298.1 glycerate kinase [Paraburkholderia caribensis]PTB28606.1 glycerate kinase [Paraburkholderia caribensis]QLB66089.1 glycerate kinase [Paraburkholderia caribensis]